MNLYFTLFGETIRPPKNTLAVSIGGDLTVLMKSISTVGLFLLISLQLVAQESDSVSFQTPFVKGKWMSGLGGTISTSTVSLDTTVDKTFTTQYGVNFRSGSLIADRWLVGLAVGFSRRSTDSFIVEDTDLFQVGPFVRFYTGKNPGGSLFFQSSVAYVKFREKTTITTSGFNFGSLTSGDGVGIIIGIGYAFLVTESVTFDLGLNYDFSFIDAKVEDLVNGTEEEQTINRAATIFNFGFTILIDEFFF